MTSNASALKNEWFEKGRVDKAGVFPVIRFVRPNNGKAKRGAKVTIHRDEFVTDNLYKFQDTVPEYAVEHVMQFLKLLTRLELESTAAAAELIITEAKEEITAGATGARKAHLRQEIKEKKAEAKGCVDAAFTYFSDQLEADAVHDWETICARECDSLGYVAKNGVVVEGVALGRNFDGVRASLRAWLLKFCPKDSAERQKTYMSTKLIFNPDKITVKKFCERIVHMNTMLEILPTRKDIVGAPDEMERGDVPLKPYRLCEVLLESLPYKFEQMYWSRRRAHHFPTCVKTLIEELVVMEPEYKSQRALAQKQELNLQKAAAGRKLEQPIPRKRNSAGGDKAGGGDKRPKKNCELCAKWMPKCQHSHNTADCRIFNKDGSRKQRGGGDEKGHRAQSKLSEENFLECFAQMKKSNKALMEAIQKRESRSRGRSRRDPPCDGRYRRSRRDSGSDSDASYY